MAIGVAVLNDNNDDGNVFAVDDDEDGNVDDADIKM